ncbi:MAG TPA: BON domain-containing protein [Methylomirabilota bacterium]|nr:BON domain-containing protein [Methylomirabilota bacterium]
MRSRTVVLAVLALSHTACTTTLVVAYQTLTDVRTMEEQTDDARIMGTIKDQLATKQGVGSALQVHVFAHLGRVVVAGIVPVRSLLAADAVAVAHAVPGVRKVDVVFIPVRSSYPRDLTISLKLDAKIVADLELRRSQLEWTVLDGTVVLTGVVDDPAKAARAVEHAKSIDNVTAVRSFIQIRQPTKRREPR